MVGHALGSFRSTAGAGPEGERPRSDGPLLGVTMLWAAAAEELLRRIPIRPVRRMVIERVEAYAWERGFTVVALALYEEALRPKGAG